MNDPQTAQESLQYLRRCLAAAQAEPNNTFLVTQLEAAVSIHNAAEYLEDRERRHARDLKQATLPEGYTLLRGEEHPGYEHGWIAPNGKRYGFWDSQTDSTVTTGTHDMFDTLRDLISSRRAAARAEILIAKAKHRTDRLVARADRSSVSRLASAVEGVQAAFIMWLKGPSTPSSDVAVDVFIPHVMRGVAEGAAAVADYLELKAESKRKAERSKTEEQRKADELAKIVGVIYMALGQEQTVAFVVDASAVKGLTAKLSELFPLARAVLEDTNEPGKVCLLIHTNDSGEGGDVH